MSINYYVILFAFICFNHSISISQVLGGDNDYSTTLTDTVTIHPSLPKFLITVKYEKDDNDSDNCITNINIYQMGYPHLIQKIIDSSGQAISVKLDDINFDGYKDLCLGYDGMSLNENYLVWFYVPKQSKFALLNNERLSNYSIDTVNKEISSIWCTVGGHGDSKQKYRIINNQFVLYEESYSNDEWSEVKRLINGVMQTISKTTIEETKNDTIILEISYKLLYDSLRITQKIWKRKIDHEPPSDQLDLYEQNPWGSQYLYVQMEYYDYYKDKTDRILLYINRYKATNNRLILDTVIVK